MAKRKKTKSKAKKAKKTKKKTAARKAAARKKPAAKKAPKAKAKKAKAKAKKAKAKPKAARKKAAVIQPVGTAPAGPSPGDRIGVVTHYYSHLSVAIVQLESGSLRVGEMVRIKGHTSDFIQPVESMEVDHVHVNEAHAGQSFGLRVKEHAREHDVVYRLAQ